MSTAPASRSRVVTGASWSAHAPHERARRPLSAPLLVDEVLKRDRNAVQGTAAPAGGGLGVERAGLGDRAGAEHGDEHMKGAVVRVDLCEAGTGQFLDDRCPAAMSGASSAIVWKCSGAVTLTLRLPARGRFDGALVGVGAAPVIPAGRSQRPHGFRERRQQRLEISRPRLPASSQAHASQSSTS